MDDWLTSASRLAREIAWQARRAAGAIGRARGGGYQAQGYLGYGTGRRVLLLARAMQEEHIAPPVTGQSRWANLVATLQRLDSVPLPFARVRATVGGGTYEAVADDEGFVHAWLTLAPALPASGWHAGEVVLMDPPGATLPDPRPGIASFLVPPPLARFGVVSDLDDTVIQSEVANFLRAARIVLMENALTRLPFPGVAAFYRALTRGASGAEQNPVFYVSSSPWNIYDVIEDFLEAQGIPEGPLLLRDWDLRPDLRDHSRYKGRAIRQILDTYPSLPFILVGDSTQEDPEIYSSIVREYPARVLAVYIRNVSAHPERVSRIRELASEVDAAGSALLLADDTHAAAKHAASKGYIASDALAEIGAERAADEGRGDAKESAPGVETPKAPTVVVDESK